MKILVLSRVGSPLTASTSSVVIVPQKLACGRVRFPEAIVLIECTVNTKTSRIWGFWYIYFKSDRVPTYFYFINNYADASCNVIACCTA